ncbi:glycosyltransferase family 32 protein [Paratractidigestivibacter faecalis]|uniref:glycosyltransferase family 32 protein n=1 Tax=Paratractidigestivibacter faecalis TaxID=2292441 RepID=UPI003F9A857D
MISKVIHYCWFGGKPLPHTARKCLQSWERFCPDYEIKRWDETNFDTRQHPFVASAYDAGAWAFVSDWARLKILYDNGGIYLDTDVKLIKTLDGLLDNQCYIGVQQSERLCTTGLGFGCLKSSPVVHEMLAQYDGLRFDWAHSQELACPHLNDEVVRAHGYSGDGLGDVERFEGLTVYPSRFFDPIAPGDSLNLMGDDTISVSLYANSWGSKWDRVRRSVINAIGQERTRRIAERLRK